MKTKNQKSGLVGRVLATAKTGGGAALGFRFSAFCHKIGSSEVVKSHQFSTNNGRSARKRRFFFGFAQQNPDVFLGGMSYRARQEPRCFV